MENFFSYFGDAALYSVAVLAGVIFGALIILNIIRLLLARRRYYSHQIFLVRLPKEKPHDDDKEVSVSQMKEEIAKGETIFSAIGGLKAQRGFMNWLTGRSDQFSFEIVANHNRISFYVAAPYDSARYLEQQIHAHYPQAVIEELEDYNSFSLKGQIAAGYLRPAKSFIFPLKTYQKMDVDPLNSLINILSKLDKDESLAIQYTVRSAKGSWHRISRRVAASIIKKQSVKNGLRAASVFGRFLHGFDAIFKTSKPRNPNDPNDMKKLSVVEEEMLKSIEEKNLKAGLDVNVRVVACARTKEKANVYLENVSSAFMEYNNFSYGNVFSRLHKSDPDKTIKDFIYRYFREPISFLLNSEELASIFHFPLSTTETPNIFWLTAKIAPAPATIPTEGITLGENVYRGVRQEIRIKRDDRRRHTYIIGKSGVGKSVLLANMAIQDIQNGEGVCVLDPHGDLIQDILDRLPPERAEDVIVFSPGDRERPLALNLLDYDERYPEQKSFVINEMIGIFDKLYDLKATGGPMFEQYMRNAMLLVMDDPASGSTLMEIPKVLADEEFRRLKLSRCKNQTVVDFWRKEAEKAGGEAALANIVPYITSKLTSFISNDMMRPIIGQQKSAFNLREVMDSQKILLIDMPKGIVGEMNAYLLGMILVGKILMAALSRTDLPKEARKDFYLYIDEFQNFTTNSVCQILSEARKYSLNLIIAHQYIGQLVKNNNTEIKDAVFGNVGTMVNFKVGPEDADFLVKEFAPVFNEYDLINVDKGLACLKLLVDNSALRPFSLKTIWPLLGVKHPGLADKVRALSRLKYGQNVRLVEAEISRRNAAR
ncbi:MAG: type IV secretion system DNA-binding domain-containing protein [bacterium]|nr:type IV secretion system DNA-binding domain-containing protein [bacterium]